MNPAHNFDQRTRAILESADDPTHVWGDPRLDWPDTWARVEDLSVTLARIAGRPFELDGNVQDATFLTDLSVVRRVRTATGMTLIETVFALRFSNFGMLFTSWSYCETEQLSDELIEALVQATSAAGFQYVPRDSLSTPYTGQNPVFSDATWWDRFFDYV